jgi:AbrB family looped-hinge helix DNA binding protein
MRGKENSQVETYATVKGQIVIPASLRRKYGIKNGTKIIVTDIGDAILLKPVTEQYLKNLQGSLKGKGGLKVLVEERRKDKEREK